MFEEQSDASGGQVMNNDVTVPGTCPADAGSPTIAGGSIDTVEDLASTADTLAAADRGKGSEHGELAPQHEGQIDACPDSETQIVQALDTSDPAIGDETASQSGGGEASERGKSGEGVLAPVAPLPLSHDASRSIGTQGSVALGDDIYRPAPVTNPVVQALQERGLYVRPEGEGTHRIRCPFSGDGTEAMYVEPSETVPRGTFLTWSSMHEKRRIGDLLTHLNVDADLARCKARIALKKGETHRIVSAAQKVLAMRGAFYASNGQIVRLSLDAVTHEPSVTIADEQMLLIELSAGADWVKYDGRSQEWQRSDVPTNIVTALLKAREFPHLPKLNGLARQPYLRKPDREVIVTPGFDVSSGIYAGFDPGAFKVPDATRGNAEAALDRLKALLCEFEFATEADRSAALCAMLTASVRDHLPIAPAFNITASSPGSGKSYLANVIAPFAGSGDPRNISYPSSAEEATKVVLSLAMEQPAVVLFDDMAGDWIPHGALNRMLTSGTVAERKLGTNLVVTARTCSFVMGTGNNIRPLRDMARRVVSIYLQPQTEAVATRHFSGKPDREVKANRGSYVSDALTIVTAWLGCERALENLTNVAGFDDWSYLCRQPLIWLGLPDPAGSLIQQMTHDPDAEQLGELLQEWSDVFGHRAVTVRKVLSKAEESKSGELFGIIRELPCSNGAFISAAKFGRYLARNRNRIVNGLKLVDAPNSERKAWAVVRADAPAVDTSPAPRFNSERAWMTPLTEPLPPVSIDDIF